MGMLFRYHYADIKEDNSKNEGVTKAVAPEVQAKEEKKADKPETTITAEEIDSMNGTKLRKFAKEHGVDKPEDLTVGELRAVLHEMFS